MNETVEQPCIALDYLERASADAERVKPEITQWRRDPDGYISRRFIALSEWDFPAYAAGNIKIQNKVGRLVYFNFNRVQRQLWKWFLEDLAAGRPIRWYILKARQMGVSTWILALFYWLTSMRPNRNALITAHDEASTQNFNSRIRSIHAESHPLLKSQTILERRDVIQFGNKTTERQKGAGAGLDSRLIFSTAQRGELGRSYNFHAVLLSEFAIWPELGIDVASQMVALNQTIAELPGTIVILETTAKGENAATEMYRDQSNGYRKIFITWVAFDDYRSPMRRGEKLEDICTTDEVGGRPTRYGNEVEEARLIEDALRIWYAEDIKAATDADEWMRAEVQARLNWRRQTIDKKCLGNVQQFRKEYPTIAAHAFASTSRVIFDQHSVNLMREHLAAEALPARRFHYDHNPEETDANKKFQLSPFGQVHVYKMPEAGQTYVMAGDPGMGIPNSGDPSALIVLAVPDLEEVASFNQIITPDKFAELAFYLGRIYNTALLGIENNERGGYAANLILSKQMHYPRLYYRFDPFDKKATAKPGFNTTDTNKSVMVSATQQTIRDHEILLRTPALLEQLDHYVLLPNGTMGGAPGWNDDLISALLIAVHLSTKIHMYAQPPESAPKGSFAWHAQRHAERQKPGMFGYKR